MREARSRGISADNAYQTVKLLLEEHDNKQYFPEIDISIRQRMPIAISTAAKLKDRKNAFKWLFSKYYRNKILTPRGIKRMLETINIL